MKATDLPAHDLLKDFLTGEGVEVTNPSDLSHLAYVKDCKADDVRDAIGRAEAALPDWRDRNVKERADILRAWFEAIMARKEDLARLMTLEQGKVITESRGEVEYGASFVEWFGEEAKRVYGDHIPSHDTDKRMVVIKQAVGVVAAITPWNFPIAMITRKISPALAAGCTVVVKPAALTPLCALAIMKLAHEAGVPEDAFITLTSSDAATVGEELCKSSTVRKLSFTGSTKVGKILAEQSASTLKKLSMELGGNAPFIVFDDADIDAAVEGAIACKFRNAGQTCVCANRVMVQDGIYDEFMAKFRDAVAALKVGDGLDDDMEIGPLVEEAAVDKVEELVEDATSRGGELIGGGRMEGRDGWFYRPGIIDGATTDMRLAEEEIFGPIAPVFRFSSDEEAMEIANDTAVGLAAYFYSRDIGRIWRVAEALEYGMVGINAPSVSTELAPFGGVKESGFGREGSKYGVEEYVEIKALHFGGIGEALPRR
ncbi:NAD-dependent succinate-semialdehyde dehydrogenase [Alteriqipengyuania flavescens]|uniref:NAD-dependent succinate-semialdehyde dehydrogenase n=1 Tax=Alteriqipengyuania flavescens TaxID=3053610 RepID=UPI0025B51FF4|nr:NAD-dependent succinate-semialdehyde dehydrogenase [Alteriqipengyuania flavescens]WJY18928.1 NAD-dependent succinate-semialdehyde dehydrogenase [Alteriqipengyuania flavescens]WJY24868.1 NAD-dependent succinate-semialdehyde dehydrogenase [Alteriqipengyuania flavescens]